jgi:GalNAc-alpha-(1->4)-GalNAc-alpha-(1->3)-diNAcBac-PP-undecaprenol alpha-1,4-N-acetyl-D-galactosaminyltransferase
MKVALVISSLSTGGAERVISLLANHWAARGEDVSLITIDSGASDCYGLDPRIQRVALGLRADSHGVVAAVTNNWRRIRALRSALGETGASIVLSFGEFTNIQVLLATRLIRMRCVISERTDPARHHVGAVWHLLRRLTYRMADALVVQTDALLPWARSMAGADRAHVIPNPVRDMQRHCHSPDGARTPLVAAAGRLVAAKGFDVLLEAFAALPDEMSHWKLVILGEGPERARLADLANKRGIAGRVSLPGWVAEPGEVWAGASVFALPSRYEGFPNALIEAMACGLAVVATACTGPAAIVSHEVDGLLVPIDSPAELAAALLRLMKDETLRSRLGRNAAAVSIRYKLDSIVEHWDRLLGLPDTHVESGLDPTPASPQ